MLTREEYVAVCETCIKRKHDFKIGIVCSLTDAHADFDTTCPFYEKDQLAIERIERIKQYQLEESRAEDPLALEQKMESGSILWGTLITFVGFIWLVAGLALDLVFIYPLALLIAGLIMLFKGIRQKAKLIQKKPDTSQTLDDIKDLDVT